MAQEGGVLTRPGHTEAGCDLASLAGLEPAAVTVEIMNDDGSMARRPQLLGFSQERGVRIGTIADLIEYRSVNKQFVKGVSTA
jgi:3,4-dihydroxy 2-butanone 4-phosphate synthase/GTP cyclohydrolase II